MTSSPVRTCSAVRSDGPNPLRFRHTVGGCVSALVLLCWLAAPDLRDQW